MKIYYKTINTPFEYPFTISKGTKTHQPALIVALELGPFIGVGEAPAIAYYDMTVERMVDAIQAKKTMIEKFAFTTPDRYWHYLHHLLPKEHFLVAALDIAAWDLFGKMRGKLLYELWDTQLENHPITDYTIGMDTIDVMLKKIDEHPWPIYKIKLGSRADIEIIQAIRKHTNAQIRVDANAGWSLEDALTLLPILQELNVELIEQPLAKDNWDGMKVLFNQSPIPLIADESCVYEADVEKCHQHFHGINIKLTKCSGITPALRMIEQARKLHMKVMMGSMNETSIGSAAIAHFLPQLDFVDMDGPLLLTTDQATGLTILPNAIKIDGTAGLGIQPLQW